jgi:IclR family transcriptional regulator, pca regulon regulatory protein
MASRLIGMEMAARSFCRLNYAEPKDQRQYSQTIVLLVNVSNRELCESDFMATRQKPRSKRTLLESKYIVPGLQRGLALLSLFDKENPRLRLSAMAKRLALTRSALFRVLYTLERSGFLLKQEDTEEYSLAPKVLELGFTFLTQLPITEVAQPVLNELAEKAQASAHLVILDLYEAVHIARATPGAPLVSNLPLGTRRPAHAIASGRALLSFKSEREIVLVHDLIPKRQSRLPPPSSLEEFLRMLRGDRERGYVFCQTAFEVGLMSCACAVRNHMGEAVASVTVVGPKAHMETELGEDAIASMVCESAQSLSVQLGFQARTHNAERWKGR